MGEAIISRFGAAEDGNSVKMEWKLYTEIITENTNYTVPTCKNQELHVLIFGGGGSTKDCYNSSSKRYWLSPGGGGGNMNKGVLELAAGSIVPITIGQGGIMNFYQNMTYGNNGGTTSFGGYLSATGGCAPVGYNGGDGGSGGGTSGYGTSYSFFRGGHGSYGGGGGTIYGSSNYPILGNGGIYGGAGGYGVIEYFDYNRSNIGNYFNIPCSGLGRPGYLKVINNTRNNFVINYVKSTNGVSDIDVEEFNFGINYNGYRLAERGATKGNISGNNTYDTRCASFAFGGGGGYGGKGGDGDNSNGQLVPGGGGGYMANGGNGFSHSTREYCGCGGGGGYGGKGADGALYAGGGGGGYGPHNFASGGTFGIQNNGNNGICIIQYYGVVYV